MTPEQPPLTPREMLHAVLLAAGMGFVLWFAISAKQCGA